MKVISKLVLLAFFSFSPLSFATSANESLYEKLYRIAEKMYYSEYSLSTEQKQLTFDLATKLEIILDISDGICGTNLTAFQDAYKWAKSFDGLNEFSFDAEKFATLINGKYCPGAYLDVYKSSYEFARSSSGLNKMKSDAKQFASQLSEYELTHFYMRNTLQCYIASYNFAYSSSGMNKTRWDSEKFANKQCLNNLT